MGTSKGLAGPRGGQWSAAHRRLDGFQRELEAGYEGAGPPGFDRPLDHMDEVGEAYRKALADTLDASPGAFGLRQAMSEAGGRLLTVLDDLAQRGVATLGPLEGKTADERLDVFAARFVDAAAGSGGQVVDAVIRQAVAGRVVETLLAPDTPLGHAVREGTAGQGTPIVGELLCTIYQWFFADTVGGFVKAVIAEKIKLAVPVLYAVDPAGKIADWIAERIVAVLPSPCEEQQRHPAEATSLSDVARGLVQETVDRALGIQTGQEAVA